MKVFINGTNNANKGAELMFCAICQELEKRHPYSEVIMPSYMVSPWKSSKLVFKHRRFSKLMDFFAKYKIAGVLRILHLPYVYFLRNGIAPLDLDVMFSAHGYGFGDVWQNNVETGRIHYDYLNLLRKHNTKSIFLPQAFGPFSNQGAIATGKAIIEKSDLVCAREQASYNHLEKIGLNMSNVYIYPDFTAIVEGTKGITLCEDAIVLIPNMRMITEAGIQEADYYELFRILIARGNELKKEVVLFNHESLGDLNLCKKINSYFGGKYRVISGLNALDTKGALANAYAVVSSRFHGAANCLASNVPVVSSSWNPKYELLYEEYGLKDMIFNIQDHSSIKNVLYKILNTEENKRMRQYLTEENEKIKEKIYQMWNHVFSICEQK